MAFQSLAPWRWFGEGERDESLHTTPAVALSRFNQNMEHLLDEFINSWPFGSMAADQWPLRADVEESDKEYLVTVDLPDMREDEVELHVKNGLLTIAGKHESMREQKGSKQGNVHSIARQFTSFQRTLTLPPNADENKIEASFNNGKLTIIIPKLEKEAEKQNRIPIRSKKKAA